MNKQRNESDLMALLKAPLTRPLSYIELSYTEQTEQAEIYVNRQIGDGSEMRRIIYGYLGMQAENRIQDIL